MRVLAVDPGSKKGGWALFDGEELLTSGNYRCKGDDWFARAYDGVATLQRLLDVHAPEVVAIEKPESFGAGHKSHNSGAVAKLLAAVAMLAQACLDNQVEPVMVPVRDYKGQLSKANAHRRARRMFPGHDWTEDEADAVFFGARVAGSLDKWRSYQSLVP